MCHHVFFMYGQILCSFIIVVLNYICHTHSLIIIMANTNRTNPNAEPPRRSNRAAGKPPTARPSISDSRNHRGKRKDPPESIPLQATVQRGTQRKDLPHLPHGPLNAIRPHRPPPWEPRGGGNLPPDESPVLPPEARGGDNLLPDESAPVEPPTRAVIDTMPTLVRQDCASAHVLRRYPGQNNRSPFFTPPKQINAASLVDGDDMTLLDHLSPAGATLAQIRYAQEHLVGKEDEGKNSEDCDCAGFEDNDFEDDDDSKDGDFSISEAGAGNNLVKDSTCCGLFEYSENDYNHLDDDDFNEEEMRIKNGDIKKRVKTGRRRGNLIVGGPVEPKYDIMSVAEAHEARIQYLSDRKKFRDDKRRERIRENMGSSFNEADYTGDLTATLRPMSYDAG